MRIPLLTLIAAAGLIAFAAADRRAASQQPPASAVQAAAASADKPPGEVTVTGKRSELEPRVAAFVQQISGSYYDDGLARWTKPVCPRVTGLPQEEDEFILERVSDIARAAGIPLAGDKCHVNLYILVTDQPRGGLHLYASGRAGLVRHQPDESRGTAFGADVLPGR
jgi:hypothetical protein